MYKHVLTYVMQTKKMHVRKHTNIQTYKHTNKQTYTHTHIYNTQIYMHILIHTYIHTFILAYRDGAFQVKFMYTTLFVGVQLFFLGEY